MDDTLRDIPTTFDTERLTLRWPMPGDGATFHAGVLASIEELRPWLAWVIPTPTEEQMEARIRHKHAHFIERTELVYLIFLKGTSTFIGSTWLHSPDWAVPSFEIGYWACTAHTGKGYITEAVISLRDMALQSLGAHRLQIVCNAANQRSAAVARRAGFELEGTLRCSARHHLTNELMDEYFFSFVRREREARTNYPDEQSQTR